MSSARYRKGKAVHELATQPQSGVLQTNFKSLRTRRSPNVVKVEHDEYLTRGKKLICHCQFFEGNILFSGIDVISSDTRSASAPATVSSNYQTEIVIAGSLLVGMSDSEFSNV